MQGPGVGAPCPRPGRRHELAEQKQTLRAVLGGAHGTRTETSNSASLEMSQGTG